jgi:hypothetical protein
MQFIYRTIAVFLATFFIFSVCISAQTKPRPQTSNSVVTALNGAYAGVSPPSNNPFNNGTISFRTYTFYFRSNGTYTTELDESNWQTRVDGTYRIAGNKVFIQPKSAGDRPEEIEIKESGNLYYRFSYLLKYEEMNKIPEVIVESKSITSTGNSNGNLANVGNSSFTVYNFDGRGNFSNNRESTTFVSGANVGGGVSGGSGGGGTYTLRNGLLTLNYQDGTVVKKSFFYSEDEEGDGTALINGIFYFEPDEPKQKVTETKNSSKTNQVITTLNGAYAGSSVPVFFPGGGSSSSSYRYYFRPNGTYTTELGEPNWQTRIDGNYRIANGKVKIIPNTLDEKPFEMDIEEEGASLVKGGNTLFKLNVMNSIPAVIVENSGGASSGGNGTGTTFVGVSFYGVYNFDGKGRFSNNSSSSSVISGANVGGGSSNESGGGGTYTIKDSLLTLKYDNGKVVKKSFFYIEFSHGGTALIDGSLYYEPDKPERNTAENPPNENQNTNPNAANNPLPRNSEIAQRGLSILKKANYAHGGANLDNLETLRLIGKGSGLDIVILVDVKNQRVRNEIRKKGVLVLAEQFDGTDNWQFADGKKTKLHEVREAEMQKIFKTGLFALQSQSLAKIEFLTVEVNNQTNLKSLMLLIDGKKNGMIFDADNRLVAELSADDGILQTDYSSDFKPVSGVLLPFKSKFVEGTKTIEVKYSSIEVNPSFNGKDWEIPNLS